MNGRRLAEVLVTAIHRRKQEKEFVNSEVRQILPQWCKNWSNASRASPGHLAFRFFEHPSGRNLGVIWVFHTNAAAMVNK